MDSTQKATFAAKRPMTTENPYQTPAQFEPSPRLQTRMMWSSIAAVFVCAIVGGGLGMGLGAIIGNLFPGYYRDVFASGSSPGFDPVAAGMAAGLTQGVTGGAIIGLALVALFYWFRIKVGRPSI